MRSVIARAFRHPSRPARLLTALVLSAAFFGPVQAANPSPTGSVAPLSGTLQGATTRPLPQVHTGEPLGNAAHRPVPNLGGHSGPVLNPKALSIAPSGRRETAVGNAWAPLGPQPLADERCCDTSPGTDVGNASGRVTSLVRDPNNANVVYAGAAGGGVWKSTNGGTSWNPLTDGQVSLAIGALGIDATGQVIYAGTGEDNQSDSQYGQGVLVSTNGGTTWTLTGQSTFTGKHIGDIAVDRTNSQHALAATDVGLYVTANGGASWIRNTQILGVTTVPNGVAPSGGIFQVVQDPSNPLTFWASVADFCQTEYGDILVSTNGGIDWTPVFDAFNTFGGYVGRIGLGVGTNGVAYVAVAGCDGNAIDVDKTANYGGSWVSLASASGLFNYFNLSGNNSNPGQGTYDNVVAVDPTNGNNAVFGGVTILATSDGGTSFKDVGDVYGESVSPGGFIHPDYHAVAFFGAKSFYVGNDGGVWKTTTLGGNGTPSSSDWTDLNATLDTIQFYTSTALDTSHLLGGAQDNGSSGNLPGAAAEPSWQGYHGGDGGYTAIDPNSTTIYAEYPHLFIERGSSGLNSADQYSPYDSFQTTAPCDDAQGNSTCFDPTAFVAPFRLDPTNPQRLLAGTNRVYESTNAGSAWNVISPDLATGTAIPSGADYLSRIAMGQQTGQTGIIFTGSEFGTVEMTTNDGGSWTDITGNLPTPTAAAYLFPNPWISGIAFNPANPQEAWVTLGGVGVPNVWHTTNAGAGATWTSLGGSGASALPDAPVSGIVLDPSKPGVIYIGTYYGAMACSSCGGASPSPSWSVLGSGLPNSYVNDLTLTADGSHLIAWTHGRGAWAMSLAAPVSLPNTVFLPFVAK